MARKKIKAYKGFEHDWTCRGFQYEIGKTYTQTGDIKVCNNGFHACEEPLKVFGYYTPCDNYGNLRKFAEVEQSGEISNDNDKTASSKIKIKTELSLMDLAKLQVEYIKEQCQNTKKETRDWSCATNSGNSSCAEVEKSNSVAFAFGYQSRARAKDGWIIIVDWREDEGFDKYIENIYTAKVGGEIKNKKIKSNVWYWFEDGELKNEE